MSRNLTQNSKPQEKPIPFSLLPIAYWLLANLSFALLAQETDFRQAGVRVAIWGEVKRPGAYYLSGAPDILELISQAGGPTSDANLSKITLIQGQTGKRRKVNLKGEPIFLAPGDIVVVPRSFFASFKEILPLITTVAAGTNLVVTLLALRRK